MSRKKEIFKDVSIYSISSYIAQMIDMIHGIVLRNLMGPANMGVWAFLQVIQNYAKHSGLGITTATARDVPYYIGKGDQAKADKVKDLVFTFTLITSVLTALGVAIFGYCHKGKYSEPIFYGLFIVSGVIVLQRIYNLYVVLLRSYKEFVFAGFLNIASAAVTLILTLVLVWRFKLYGFYAALITHYILMLGIINWKTKYRFSFNFHWNDLLPLLSLGSAMVISDILRTVLVSIDRIMIAKYFGFTELGYYSIALMANNYLYALPNMLGIILFPHFQEVFAKNDNHRDLERYLREPTLCTAYLFPFVIGFVWTFSAWIVPLILPQFTAGIPALRYLVLGSFFMSLTHAYSNFVITVRKHWQLLPLQGISTAFGFGITWCFIKLGWGIEGVALAVVFVALSQFFILSLVSMMTFHNVKKTVQFYLKVFVIFGIFVVALVIAHWVCRPIQNTLIKFMLEYAVFALMISPFVWRAEKEFGIVTTIRHMLHDRMAKRSSDIFKSGLNGKANEDFIENDGD